MPLDFLHVGHRDSAFYHFFGVFDIWVDYHVHFGQLEDGHDIGLSENTGDVFRIEREFEAINCHTLLRFETPNLTPLKNIPHNEVLLIRSIHRPIKRKRIELIRREPNIQNPKMREKVNLLKVLPSI